MTMVRFVMYFFAIFAAVFFVASNCAEDGPFIGQRKLTLGSNYVLEWTVKEPMITIKITAPAKGWVGFGISPTRTMQYADMMMAGVDANGQGYILDTIGFYNGAPFIDPQQNWTGLEYSQVNGSTSVVASRALKTGDSYDRDVTEGKLAVLWAYNADKDVMNGIPKHRHTARGVQDIDLMSQGIISGMKTMTATPTTTTATTQTAATPTAAVPKQQRFNTTLGTDITLEWFYTDDEITFEVSASTDGWVGIGFSPGTDMVNADLIVFGKTMDSSYIHDAHSPWNGPPITSEQQDVTLVSVTRESGKTKGMLRRKLDTGDSKDRPIQSGDVNVLWAYGSMDVLMSNSYLVTYHSQRGSKTLKLLSQ